jgi:glycosyltransferase involved in cell wall biosynthesis
VGSLEMRKNLVRLFRAFERSRLTLDGYTLTVVGGDGHGADTIRNAAGQTSGVILKGFVSDEELRALYQTSAAFIYPSCLEGFGLPIIEAASWGLPIMTSSIGACAENAPPLSVLVDPYNVPDIADALRRMAGRSDAERAQMRDESLKHAATFTFDRYLDAMKVLIGLPA